MSIRMIEAIWERVIPKSRKMVLMRMANYADDEGGGIYPTVTTLADYSGWSMSTVAGVLKDLRDDKIIEVTGYRKGDHGQIPIYKMDIDKVRELYPLVAILLKKQAEKEAALTPATGGKADALTPATGGKAGALTPEQEALTPEQGGFDSRAIGDNTSYNRHLDSKTRARGETPRPPPACAHWKSKWQAMVAVLNEKDVCKVEDAIVHGDDGKTVVLWVESEEAKEEFERRFKCLLEPVLNRKLAITVNEIAARAKRRRLSGQVVVNTEDARVAFESARTDMIDLFGAENFGSWLAGLEVTGGADGEVVLRCPTQFFREWVGKHYAPVISQLLGRDVVVEFGAHG